MFRCYTAQTDGYTLGKRGQLNDSRVGKPVPEKSANTIQIPFPTGNYFETARSFTPKHSPFATDCVFAANRNQAIFHPESKTAVYSVLLPKRRRSTTNGRSQSKTVTPTTVIFLNYTLALFHKRDSLSAINSQP
jgi:hypothetical protein